MDINNQDNFSQLINLSLLTTFYTQLKNQFVLIDNYNDFYNSVNQKIQKNTKNIDDIKINLNNNYYTKDDIDSEFDLLNQGIMTNYYSKTDIDSKIIVINNNINNLSQNLNNNYYNKAYIDNNFLSLNGGTLQGNLTAPTFIGNLNGNANTSSLANKVSNKLIFTGGFVGEYDGSSELNVIIPTSGSTEGVLTIQLNGGTTEDVDKITFNGATNKSINITPESIGAITQSILNNYLPLTGGTLTGSLTATIFNGNLNGNATSSSKVNNKLTFTGYQSYIYDGSSDISVEIPNLLSQLTNDTNFATISYVDSKVSSVYKFKGSVENYSDLPTSGNEVGDVWDIINADPTNNIKAGDNVVWTGTTWDNLGGMVDLTNYYTKDIIDNKLDTINQSITNIDNNLSTNYYNKEYINNVLNNYLPVTGGTVNGSITANEFIGSLNGNATTATTATKLNNKLIFTGDVSAIYDGSQEVTINITAGTQGNYLPITGGTLTGDLNSQNILPSSNSIYNIGSQSMKYNIIYANTFDGNATSSDISKKVANKLIFTGATTGTYDGSSETTINIPEFQQTNGILTIQLNGGNVEGSNKFTFNGSVNKTINITPSSIGAATSSSLNNYLPLSGGTISGNLSISGTLSVSSSITTQTIYSGSWFRSTGATGWYNETYGGGIYMNDSSWIRTYNGKNFYCSATCAARSIRGDSTSYLSTNRFQNGWIGFYSSASGAQSASGRKGWIGHDGGTDLYVYNEAGGRVVLYTGSGNVDLQGYRIKMTSLAGGGSLVLGDLSGYNGYLSPLSGQTKMCLGTTSYYWYRLYSYLSVSVVSDIRKKTNIKEYDERFEHMYMDLKPITYELKDDLGQSHCGLIAQWTKDTMDKYNINENEFGAYIHNEDNYSICYEELVSLNMHMIQKTIKHINIYDEEIAKLKLEIEDLKNKLKNIYE